MHLTVALVILADVQLSQYFGVAKQGLVTLALFFMIIVVVNDCVVLFKAEEDDGENAEDSEPQATSLMPVAKTIEPNRKMLLTWFAIEGLMFAGNLISHAILVSTSLCCRRTNLTLVQGSTRNFNSLASLVSSYTAPFIASTCLLAFGFGLFPEIKNNVWAWVISLLSLQAVQAIIALIVFPMDPADSKCKIACQNVLASILMVILPLVYLAAYATLLSGSPETKELFPYFTFTVLLQVLMAVWFFVSAFELL